MAKPFGADFDASAQHGLFRGAAAGANVVDRLQHDALVETKRFSQGDQMLWSQSLDRQVRRVADRKRQLSVLGIERRCDEIVGRRQPQPVRRVEHRKILQVRIGVAGEKASKDPPVETPGVDRRAARRSPDERRQVVVSSIVFVITRPAAEQLIELLKMPLGPARKAVEALNNQRPPLDPIDGRNPQRDELVVREQRAVGDGRQVLVLNDVTQRAGRQLRDEVRGLSGSRRTKAPPDFHRQELWLNPRQRGTAR